MGAPRLMLIASQESCADLPGALAAALSALPRGGVIVQLREKALAGGPLLTLARELLPICRAAGAPLLVNDRCDIAHAGGLAGVHLPANGLSPLDARALLGPEALIGVSCHSSAEVADAARAGADLCLFGPVYDVPGKGAPQGLTALSLAARAAAIPVFALGGMDPHTAASALAAGARGIACQRAVLGSAEPAAAARALWSSLSSADAA